MNPSPLFLVVGEASFREDNYARGVHTVAKRMGSRDVVRFTGFRADIARTLAAMDPLAFPSYEESFGLALLEAMAMKVPIVACRSAGVLDIVEDGISGLLVPPKDAQALATGIIHLLHDGELRNTVVANARRRVELDFSAETVLNRLETRPKS